MNNKREIVTAAVVGGSLDSRFGSLDSEVVKIIKDLGTYPKSYVYDQLRNKPRGNLYYLKYEADKCIGELRKERDWLAKDRAQAYDDLEKRAQLNIKQEESIRHHKYKRCLAMADLCTVRATVSEAVHQNDRKFNHYAKWHDRWLILADKIYKEPKCQ